MKALQKHLRLIAKAIDGKSNRTSVYHGNMRVDMAYQPQYFGGDLTLEFYQNDRHVMTYQGSTEMVGGKKTMVADQDECYFYGEMKLMLQLRAAMKELGYPFLIPDADIAKGEVTPDNLLALMSGEEVTCSWLSPEAKNGDELKDIEIMFGHGKIYTYTDVKKDMIATGYFRESDFYIQEPSTWPHIHEKAIRRVLKVHKYNFELLIPEPEQD